MITLRGDNYLEKHRLNRQKDRIVEHIREQMRDFFGLDDTELPSGLDEEALLQLYRNQLKDKCRLAYAADLAIPHPTMDRTKFRLVVGGKRPAVMEVFRDVESKIMGREAGAIRDEARRRGQEAQTGQPFLDLRMHPEADRSYGVRHEIDLKATEDDIIEMASEPGGVEFKDVWPSILERRHVTLAELRHIAAELRVAGRLEVLNLGERERAIKDHHRLRRVGHEQ